MTEPGPASARFEITYLQGGSDHPAHTAEIGEINMLVEWAGQTGVPVRIRPRSAADAGVRRGGEGSR